MSVKAIVVTVGTTATRLDATPEADLSVGSAPLIRNMSAVTVYIGGGDVTTTAGYPVLAGEQMGGEFSSNDQLWGVVATGTAEVRVLQSGI